MRLALQVLRRPQIIDQAIRDVLRLLDGGGCLAVVALCGIDGKPGPALRVLGAVLLDEREQNIVDEVEILIVLIPRHPFAVVRVEGEELLSAPEQLVLGPDAIAGELAGPGPGLELLGDVFQVRLQLEGGLGIGPGLARRLP
jgi:hypothetical protein